MVGWDRNASWNRDVLERIVVLLFALAVLAERASSRSWFVRRRVLAALRPGEEAAYRCVADAARAFGAPVPAKAIVAAGQWMAGEGGDPDDGQRLAARLRALALALCVLLMRRFALPGAAGAQAEWRKAAGWVGRPAVAFAPDTS